MGRNVKEGLDYFTLDVVLDEKFELIEAEFGSNGFAVVVKLFQRIYGQRGYYCEWSEEVALVFARAGGMGANVVSEIVRASIKRGIFDRGMFERYAILTSAGIQKRYLNAVRKRTGVKVEERYLLVKLSDFDFSSSINVISSSRNAISDGRNTQSREDSKYVGYNTPLITNQLRENAEGISSGDNVISSSRNAISDGRKRVSSGRKKDVESVETDFGSVTIDHGWQRVSELYQTQIGSLPMGAKIDRMQELYDELGEEITAYAIELTNDRQPKTPPNYMIGIMENWIKTGVKTLAQAKAGTNDLKRAAAKPASAVKEPTSQTENPFADYLGGDSSGSQQNR